MAPFGNFRMLARWARRGVHAAAGAGRERRVTVVLEMQVHIMKRPDGQRIPVMLLLEKDDGVSSFQGYVGCWATAVKFTRGTDDSEMNADKVVEAVQDILRELGENPDDLYRSWSKILSSTYCLRIELSPEALGATMLDACTASGKLETGRLIHSLMVSAGLTRVPETHRAIINMYVKLGSDREAWRVLVSEVEPGLVTDRHPGTWGQLLKAFAAWPAGVEITTWYMALEGVSRLYSCVSASAPTEGYLKLLVRSSGWEVDEQPDLYGIAVVSAVEMLFEYDFSALEVLGEGSVGKVVSLGTYCVKLAKGTKSNLDKGPLTTSGRSSARATAGREERRGGLSPRQWRKCGFWDSTRFFVLDYKFV